MRLLTNTRRHPFSTQSGRRRENGILRLGNIFARAFLIFIWKHNIFRIRWKDDHGLYTNTVYDDDEVHEGKDFDLRVTDLNLFRTLIATQLRQFQTHCIFFTQDIRGVDLIVFFILSRIIRATCRSVTDSDFVELDVG